MDMKKVEKIYWINVTNEEVLTMNGEERAQILAIRKRQRKRITHIFRKNNIHLNCLTPGMTSKTIALIKRPSSFSLDTF